MDRYGLKLVRNEEIAAFSSIAFPHVVLPRRSLKFMSRNQLEYLPNYSMVVRHVSESSLPIGLCKLNHSILEFFRSSGTCFFIPALLRLKIDPSKGGTAILAGYDVAWSDDPVISTCQSK